MISFPRVSAKGLSVHVHPVELYRVAGNTVVLLARPSGGHLAPQTEERNEEK